MVLDNEFTGDLRVENEVGSLQAAGHQVCVLCLSYGNKESYEDYKGAKIIRISLSLFLKNKLRGLNNTPLNFYPIFWSKHIKKFILKNDIDVLHVHDLWMLNSAFFANKKFKLPVIADLHENFVEALNHYKYANSFPGNILISKERWKRSEIEWCNKADYLITVIEEAVERYKSLGVPENKISVVPNYVNLEHFIPSEFDTSIIERFAESFTVTYVGGFDLHRGIESTIKAIPLLKDKIKNFKLVLVGHGKNFNELYELAKKLEVADYISFEGWQPVELLPSYIKASDVCLIPHLKTKHTDNTIPHKLFQYMLLEKPVVATNCNPIKRILEDTNAGIVYSSNNHEELAECLIKFNEHPDLRKEMGAAGKQAVLNKYNWDSAGKNLIALYNKVDIKTIK